MWDVRGRPFLSGSGVVGSLGPLGLRPAGGLGCCGLWRARRGPVAVSLGRVAGRGGQHEAGGGLGGLVVQLEQDGRVGVGGEHDAGMPDQFLHGLEVGTGRVGQGGRAVAEVVQPHRRQPGQLDEAVEAAGQPVGVQRCAVRGGERVSGVLPSRAGRWAFGALPAQVGAQQPGGDPVEGDDPAAGRGLRRADRDGAAVGDALLPDHDDAVVEVDVGPAQPGRLAAAQSAQRDQPPQGEQPVVGDEPEERGQLLDRPHRHREPPTVFAPGFDAVVGPHLRVRAARRGQLDVAGRVVTQQALADRGVQRAERRVARMRCSVAGVGGRPHRLSVAASSRNMSATCRPVSSPSRIRPRCGIRCSSTCSV
jgi:hypothetical protein